MFKNVKDGRGSTVAGLVLAAFVGYQLYLDPKAFDIWDIVQILAAVGLMAAPPIRRKA